MKPFIQELPRHYGRSPQDVELQRVLGLMAARAESDLDFTLDQFFASTASGWGLALWEDAFGLQREPGQTEELRRLRVLAKLRGTGPSTPEELRAIAQAFAPWWAEVVEFPREYRFEVRFRDVEETLTRRDALRAAVNERKPAHLAWFLVEEYLPMSFRTEGRANVVRVKFRETFTNTRGAVLLSGTRPLNGSWTLDQRLPGMGFPRMEIGLSVRNRERLGGWTVRDTMWRLNGANRLDGRKRLNAGIFKEEF